jgi:glycosyltransferase involved in cell wall biosynthesis
MTDAGRLFLDVSTLARWTGPPTGMIRVESELRIAAKALGIDVEPVFFDPSIQAFRSLNGAVAGELLGWHGAVDTYGMDYTLTRSGWRRFVPSRLAIVRYLEHRRLRTGKSWVAWCADAMQRAILAVRANRFPLRGADGRRIALFPPDLALGGPVAIGLGDQILIPSSDWGRKDPASLAAMKQRTGCRIAVICYDIIPITHPAFFPPDDVATFQRYWTGMFAVADTVIVNAGAIRDDIQRYCQAIGLPVPSIRVVPLGCQPNIARPSPRASLPAGLRAGGFALFVSTIEPRKNHALLLDVWERLLARGIPQKMQFRLVFVGRAAWMTDEVMRRIPAIGDSVVHLPGVDDSTLHALYAAAAFCLYPSIYEGYGLPVVEAFAFGKPVIASNGGALREVAGPVCETCDPRDTEAWEAAIEALIVDPARRQEAADRIKKRFRPVSWLESATAMLGAIRDTAEH